MEEALILRHMGGMQFCIQRGDGKSTSVVQLSAPDELTVEGRPQSNLLKDLRWYLERFLDYPLPPNTEVADRILRTLRTWGLNTFTQLFADQAALWYDRIRQTGLENLVLKIASDDPRILAWPWEALCDPHGTTLAQTCRLERQLSQLHDPLPLPPGLPETAISILLVIARPYEDEDVGFHAVSGPLVDWVRESKLAVHIDVLRPPTFKALQERLAAKHGHYHIVHFDGHGGYGEQCSLRHALGRVQGYLVFEDADARPNEVTAEQLTPLLTEHRIPIMVLNACQSGRIDAAAQDPFASTAAALLKAGIRSVVAMGYNVCVSGAQQFVPAFYRRLVESGNVAEATRAGRKAMLECDTRQCLRGEYPLSDWMVPVLYQQESVPLLLRHRTEQIPVELPEAATQFGDYGFIGRQDAIHRIERALLRQPATAILVHGMAGIGKTTLAMGFLRWLQYTGGLGRDDAPFLTVRWFSFNEIRSAEYVINELVAACFGANAMATPMEQKLPQLIKALRGRPLLMIWDNFESAAGIEGTEVTPLLVEPDRQLLKDLLRGLRGGRSKVLITSRSAEHWLTPHEAYRLPLAGLRGEDAWTYCNAVVRDHGLTLERADPDVVALLTELDGHPLALRSVLLRLAEVPPRRLLEEFRQALGGQTGDDSTQRIFAALSLLDRGLPPNFRPALALIGLHQRYVAIDHVSSMMGLATTDAQHEMLRQCFGALERGGLLHTVSNGIYAMHPALPGFLRRTHSAQEPAVQQFVEFMAQYAYHLTPKQLHEQRNHFALHGTNFQQALSLATPQTGIDLSLALTQSLAAFAQNSRDFATAARLFERMATHLSAGYPEREAAAYHHLGTIAEEQRDFAGAKRWHRKSLEIKERQGNEQGAANTYHQLGMIAELQRDFADAARWYRKSLEIKERQGNEQGAANTYYQLGRIAQEQRNFTAAGRWHLKSLAIYEKHGNEQGAAIVHHQLGRIAQEQRDLGAAERWYLKSLEIKEKQDDDLGAADTYHQLGIIAQAQRDFASAERWYLKSLAIQEQKGNERGAAITYHQLGSTAQEQRDFDTAERWYLKSLAIKEQQGDEHGAAITYNSLASLANAQGYSPAAGEWLLKAIIALAKQSNPHLLRATVNNYLVLLRDAATDLKALLRVRWQAMGLDQLASLSQLEQPQRAQADSDEQTRLGHKLEIQGETNAHLDLFGRIHEYQARLPEHDRERHNQETLFHQMANPKSAPPGQLERGRLDIKPTRQHEVYDEWPADVSEGVVESLDERAVNVWIQGRSTEEPLHINDPYTLCCNIGATLAETLIPENQRVVPLEDIPETGLDTLWIISSTGIQLSSHPADSAVAIHSARSGDGDTQWSASFELHISKVGETLTRRIEIVPRSATDGKLSIHILSRPRGVDGIHLPHEIYRSISVHLKIDVKSTADTVATPAVIIAHSVLHTPAGHLGFKPQCLWQKPPEALHIVLLPPQVVIVGSCGGGAVNESESWNPALTSLESAIEEARGALDRVRKAHRDLFDDVEEDDGDFLSHLERYQPAADWSANQMAIAATERAAKLARSPEIHSLARAGDVLYRELFVKNGQLRKCLARLRVGARVRFTWIKGSSATWIGHVPWSLIFAGPLPPEGEPVDLQAFFGSRFRIDYVAYSHALRSKLLGAPGQTSVGCMLYWGEGDETGKEARRHRLALQQLTAHGRFIPEKRPDDKQELIAFLRLPAPSPMSVLYFFCHCNGGKNEPMSLRFGTTSAAENTIAASELPRTELEDQPLVFVNACESAGAPAYTANMLEQVFSYRNCRAFIGTECKVPIRFASRFAIAFLHFLYRKDDCGPSFAGEAFVQARRFFWNEYGNPGGLFYSYENQYELIIGDAEDEARLRLD